MSLCTPLYKFKRTPSPVVDSLNQLLPISNDTELIQGALLTAAPLHEILINKKKVLGVYRYCEMAARLIVPGSFAIWHLYGVPFAFGGKCRDADKFNKSYDLKGSVMITPVAVFIPCDENYESNLAGIFKYHITNFMDQFRTGLNSLNPKLTAAQMTEHDNRAWLVEIIYKSSDKEESYIRLVTNIVRKGDKILVRDPSSVTSQWPRNFAENIMKATKTPMDDKALAKYNPSCLKLEKPFSEYQKLKEGEQNECLSRVNSHDTKHYKNVAHTDFKKKKAAFVPNK